jgi:hypothetical protein
VSASKLDAIADAVGELAARMDAYMARRADDDPSEFERAKAKRDILNQEVERHGAVLNKFPRGHMGLTPDHVKASPEYQAAKAAHGIAFRRLQDFNSSFVKKFSNELRAERLRRRGG